MGDVFGSVRLGAALYAAGLLAVFALGELTRSFELFLGIYLAIGAVLLNHRRAARWKAALPAREPFPALGAALFALLWPLAAAVGLAVVCAARWGRGRAV